MFNIRRNVFESNSSSSHSITIYTDDEWNKMGEKDTYLERWGSGKGHVYSKNEMIEGILERALSYNHNITREELLNMPEDELNEFIEDYDFVPSDYESEYLECDVTEYTTKSGEVLHIVCEYGYDG